MGRVICLVMGYVFGLFQTGYLYGKMNHIDIRNYGSGNSGTTNAPRVMEMCIRDSSGSWEKKRGSSCSREIF